MGDDGKVQWVRPKTFGKLERISEGKPKPKKKREGRHRAKDAYAEWDHKKKKPKKHAKIVHKEWKAHKRNKLDGVDRDGWQGAGYDAKSKQAEIDRKWRAAKKAKLEKQQALERERRAGKKGKGKSHSPRKH